MKAGLLKFWAWLKKWGIALLGGLLTLLTFGWFAKRKFSELGRVKDELALAEATAEIGKLRASRDAIEERVGEKDAVIEAIDESLTAQRRKLVEAHQLGEGKTDEEITNIFARLGY